MPDPLEAHCMRVVHGGIAPLGTLAMLTKLAV